MNCLIFNEKIYEYHYDLLEDADRAEMEQHLGNCAACHRLMHRTRKGLDLFGEWKVITEGREIVERTLQRVPPALTRRFVLLRWASLAAAVLITWTLFMLPGRQKEDTVLSEGRDTRTANAEKAKMPQRFAEEPATASEALSEESNPTSNVEEGQDSEIIETEKREQPQGNLAAYMPAQPYLKEIGQPGEEGYALADEAMEMHVADEHEFHWPLEMAFGDRDEERAHSGEAKTIAAEEMPAAFSPAEEAKDPRPSPKVEEKAPIENPFLAVKDHSISAFPIEVDSASYMKCRRSIQKGILPPREAIRVEEFINYFRYDYPQPEGEESFSVSVELGICPWNTRNFLVHIGIQGKTCEPNSTPAAIAYDVKGEVEFNGRHINSYRLLGYEDRLMGRGKLESAKGEKDAKAAGEILPGHIVTVLYEISLLAGEKKCIQKPAATETLPGEQLMLFNLYYRKPGAEEMRTITTPIFRGDLYNPRPSRDFDWATVVAGFAMLLRNSQCKGNLSYDLILDLAQGAKGEDIQGYRGEFLRLVTMAKILAGK